MRLRKFRMSKAEAVYDVLAADSTLTTLLTGGVYRIDDVPPEVNQDSMPEVYDVANVRLLPWCAVRGRDIVPVPNAPRDPAAQLTTQRQVIELYFYNDRYAGWDVNRQAADRAYALLQDQFVSATFKLNLVNQAESRDDAMQGATLLRHDYEVRFLKTP